MFCNSFYLNTEIRIESPLSSENHQHRSFATSSPISDCQHDCADLHSTFQSNRWFRFSEHICDESHKAGLVRCVHYLPWQTASSLCSSWPAGELLSFNFYNKVMLKTENTENYAEGKLHKITLTATEKSEDAGNRNNLHIVFAAATLKVLMTGYFRMPTTKPTDSMLKTGRIWPLNKNLYPGCPTPKQARRRNAIHSPTGKHNRNSDEAPGSTLRTSFTPHTNAGLRRWGSCSTLQPELWTKQQAAEQPLSDRHSCRWALILNRQLLSDLIPEQLFSFYCSPRTFL